MKKIIIPIYQGSVAKNILRTELFSLLRARKDCEILLLVPSSFKKEYFEKEFPGIRIAVLSEPERRGDFLLGLLKKILVNTETMKMKRRTQYQEDGRIIKYVFENMAAHLFARRFFRVIFRRLYFQGKTLPETASFLDRENPDLILSGHIFGQFEAELLRESQKRGMCTVGIINSWDKITTRGMAWVLPHVLLVHNQIIKKEAEMLLDMPSERIQVIGIPHYDIFFSKKFTPKERFYKSFGLERDKCVLLYCPMGKTFSSYDAYFINILQSFIDRGKLIYQCQLVVRFPPNDDVDLSGVKNLEKVIIDKPGIRFTKERGQDWDMNDHDIQNLKDLLFYSDVLVVPPSSLSIDAAVFDKPVINLCFRIFDGKIPDINIYFRRDHYRHILKTGAIDMAKDENSLLELINEHLRNPGKKKAERKVLINSQCGPSWGNAGKKAASVILSLLDA